MILDLIAATPTWLALLIAIPIAVLASKSIDGP